MKTNYFVNLGEKWIFGKLETQPPPPPPPGECCKHSETQISKCFECDRMFRLQTTLASVNISPFSKFFILHHNFCRQISFRYLPLIKQDKRAQRSSRVFSCFLSSHYKLNFFICHEIVCRLQAKGGEIIALWFLMHKKNQKTWQQHKLTQKKEYFGFVAITINLHTLSVHTYVWLASLNVVKF